MLPGPVLDAVAMTIIIINTANLTRDRTPDDMMAVFLYSRVLKVHLKYFQ